jgi:hypothetical protein
MRRLIALLIILAILALAWTGGWFWLASWTDRNFPTLIAEAAARGIEVDCSDRQISGFPFAFRVSCANTAIAEQRTGTRATLSGVSGGASVFAPTKAEVALASPVEVVSPQLADPAELRWEAAKVDVGLGLSGPRDVTFDADGLSAEIPLPNELTPTVRAAKAVGTLAPTDSGGATASFTDLSISGIDAALPTVSGTAAVEISVPPRALLAGRDAITAPVSARNINVSLRSGEARMDARGEISIDAQGIVDGSINLIVAGADAIPALIANLPPEQQQIGSAIATALFIFGGPTTLDGEPASEMAMEIERGVARIGIVEIALPRVPL